MVVDSGASVNIIGKTQFNKFKSLPPLHPTTSRIFAYGSAEPLPVVGDFVTTLTYKTVSCPATVSVLDDTACPAPSLLGKESAVLLGLLHFTHHVNSSLPTASPLQKFPALTSGIGKLKNFQVHLHVDPTVPPVAQRHRRIPFHLRVKVETELHALQEAGIIEPASGPTPWVSPIVIASKPADPTAIRICVDMRAANLAIQRERFPSPTIDDMVTALSGSKFFSKLDLRHGYHQLELDLESREITTFATHIGLFRYTRLNFGICSAAEIFQKAIAHVISGIRGSLNSSDDVLVHGETLDHHDSSLRAVLSRLVEHGLTVNARKCFFRKMKLIFYGLIFSDQGVSPDPNKVAAVRNAPVPATAKELRSFLGMATYCSRFIADFAIIVAPLRQLLKKDVPFEWSTAQDQSFQAVKLALRNDTVMSYFDASKESQLVVDASPVGLGAVLLQSDHNLANTRPVAYASRALTDVEQRYSQTEREALSIVWACEHFHLYLFGAKFVVVTDHKPLVYIFRHPTTRPPPRVERWRLRLQIYDFQVVYKAGSGNPADFLSRHPGTLCASDTYHQDSTECYAALVVQTSKPGALTLHQIQTATLKDPLLQFICDAIKHDKWHSPPPTVDPTELKLFEKISSELACIHGVVVRGSRLVLPQLLQDTAISLAHEGHQGLVKTKRLLRSKVWFPRMDAKCALVLQSCLACQACVPSHTKTPLLMSPLPEAPWTELAMDFHGPLHTGGYLLVIVDEFSRYPLVELISSLAASTVLPALNKIFSIFGCPLILKTDNGPPFNGHDFSVFSESWGFRHRKIMPVWPQGNAIAERFMRNLNKTVQAAWVENRPWKPALTDFLRSFRDTPHSSTNMSPFEALFGRPMNTKIPMLRSTIDPLYPTIQAQDQSAKRRMKRDAEARSRVQEHSLQPGDLVLLRQTKTRKHMSQYESKPYNVTAVNHDMITATNKDRLVTRHASHFKRFRGAAERSTCSSEVSKQLLPSDVPVVGDTLTWDTPHDPPGSPPPARHRYNMRPIRPRTRFFRDEL